MPGALPLLLVAIITPTGTWHVGAPGAPARMRPLVSSGHRISATPGQATQCGTVVRGQLSRAAMPAASPDERDVVQPDGLCSVAPAIAGLDRSAPRLAVRVRGPPAI